MKGWAFNQMEVEMQCVCVHARVCVCARAQTHKRVQQQMSVALMLTYCGHVEVRDYVITASCNTWHAHTHITQTQTCTHTQRSWQSWLPSFFPQMQICILCIIKDTFKWNIIIQHQIHFRRTFMLHNFISCQHNDVTVLHVRGPDPPFMNHWTSRTTKEWRYYK